MYLLLHLTKFNQYLFAFGAFLSAPLSFFCSSLLSLRTHTSACAASKSAAKSFQNPKQGLPCSLSLHRAVLTRSAFLFVVPSGT
jgi:hypothetical protein